MDLHGKVAFVTGASMGIGRQLSLDLARGGAVVVGVARGVDALRELLAALRPVSPRSEIVALDVADAARVREVIDDVVARHGRLDVLINNAAVEERRSILQTTLEDVERAMRVNFGGMVHCTLAALPAMVRQGAGRIVNVASAVGRSPVPGEAAYAASKAAMIAEGDPRPGTLPGLRRGHAHRRAGSCRGPDGAAALGAPYGRAGLPRRAPCARRRRVRDQRRAPRDARADRPGHRAGALPARDRPHAAAALSQPQPSPMRRAMITFMISLVPA